MESTADKVGNPSKLDTARLGMCEVCKESEAKYTCPKCEVKTCSSACLNIHKKELECDGIRDKTRYIPLKKMTTMDYMSDYNFLEECTRFVHARKRPNLHGDLPKHLHQLRMLARQKKINLQFLGRNFTKRRMNSTFYDGKNRTIFWCIEWVFVNAENKRVLEKKCSEKESLGSLLSKYVDTQNSETCDPELEHYRSRGFGGVRVLLKSERIINCGKRFYEMDLKKSLLENLRKRNIIEFPTFMVIFKELEAEFDVIETDEEDEKECSERNDSKEKETNFAGRTNFLFTDESIWDKLSSDDESKEPEK